jgi:hypothetical protein
MKKQYLIGLLAATFILHGCASQVYKKEAFKQKPKFAIVQVLGQTSGFGLGTKEDKKLLSKLESIVYKEFKSAKHFQTIHPSYVKKNRAYKSIKGEDNEGLLTLKSAHGYKKFDYEKNKVRINELMKKLKVDGVILISAGYTKKEGGISLGGFLPVPIPVSVGSVHGHIHLSVAAMDKKHEMIWQDLVEVKTEDGVGSIMGLSNFSKLYPQLIDITQAAVVQAVSNLNTNIN